MLRGDIARLDRSVQITTGDDSPLPRVKPFKYQYEKEIVMYAYYRQLDYFSTECKYAPYAYRGFTREFLKEVEAIRGGVIADLVRSGEELQVREQVRRRREGEGKGQRRLCERCGYISSNALCKACVLLQGLNKGRARVEVGHEEEKEGDGGADERWQEAIDVNAGSNREEVSAVFGRPRLRPTRAEAVTDDRGGQQGSAAFVIAENRRSTEW